MESRHTTLLRGPSLSNRPVGGLKVYGQGYVGSCKTSMWVDCYVLHRVICRKPAKDEFGKEPSEPFEFAVFGLTAKTAGAYILARSVEFIIIQGLSYED